MRVRDEGARGGPELAASGRAGRRCPGGAAIRQPRSGGPEPTSKHWAYIHRELRRPGVTLMLLWLEYKERFPDGYQYSQFCDLYRRWHRHLDLVMRQEHRAGEELFVDFAGQRIPIYDRETGSLLFEAELFVAVLGASNYTYAEAFPSQELPHWITAHVHTFEFLGACQRMIASARWRP